MLRRSVFAPFALALALPACQTAPARQAELQKQAEDAVLQSDLRAFCPQIELADGAYAYTIYAPGARGLAYQAAIADITRDCRYDHAKGLIIFHIAAAGRVVAGAAAGGGALSLPIAVKIANGDKILFSKIYSQRAQVHQADSAAQFLFLEKIPLKQAEAGKGTKITIGFAGSGGRPGAKPAISGKAPRGGILSPHGGEISIPESF